MLDNKRLLIICSLLYVTSATSVTLSASSGTPDGQGNVAKKVTIGDSALLICTVSPGGNAETDIQWKYSQTATGDAQLLYYKDSIFTPNSRGGRIAVQSPYNLEIVGTVQSDSGYYTCQGTIPTSTPQVASKYYNLTILVPPTVPTCGFPSDLAITLGQSTYFTCSSTGVPNPTYQWFKNGALLPPDPSQVSGNTYTNTSYSYDQVSGKITFKKVVAGDAGTYYCLASNEVGNEKCTAAKITTKNQDVGKIIGIVFGVIFAILLIAVLVWWTWKRGYCDSIFEGKDDHDGENSYDEGANDIVLDGAGPLVHKAPSENGKQEASMMI